MQMTQNQQNEIKITHLNQENLKEKEQSLNFDELASKLHQVAISGFDGVSPWTRESLEQSIDSSNSILVLATIDEEIAGFLIASETTFELDIYLIVVSKTFKRQYIGTKLLDYLMKYGQVKNIEFIMLETRASNASARGLYQKVGFEEVGQRKNYYTGPVEHAIVMQRDLRKELID